MKSQIGVGFSTWWLNITFLLVALSIKSVKVEGGFIPWSGREAFIQDVRDNWQLIENARLSYPCPQTIEHTTWLRSDGVVIVPHNAIIQDGERCDSVGFNRRLEVYESDAIGEDLNGLPERAAQVFRGAGPIVDIRYSGDLIGANYLIGWEPVSRVCGDDRGNVFQNGTVLFVFRPFATVSIRGVSTELVRGAAYMLIVPRYQNVICLYSNTVPLPSPPPTVSPAGAADAGEEEGEGEGEGEEGDADATMEVVDNENQPPVSMPSVSSSLSPGASPSVTSSLSPAASPSVSISPPPAASPSMSMSATTTPSESAASAGDGGATPEDDDSGLATPMAEEDGEEEEEDGSGDDEEETVNLPGSDVGSGDDDDIVESPQEDDGSSSIDEEGGTGDLEASPTDEDNVCFPAHVSVTLSDGSSIPMHKLRVGDMVRVWHGGVARVYGFSHFDPSASAHFVTLRTESGHSLTATLEHFVPIIPSSSVSSVSVMVRMRDVGVGDGVLLDDGSSSLVVSIETRLIKRAGLFNPQTSDGTIVIDGVVATTWTSSVEPKFAHAALTPFRALASLSTVDALHALLNAGLRYLAPLVPKTLSSTSSS